MCIGYYGGDCLDPYCSGVSVLTSASGNFRDHHGGGEYRHNSNCTWRITPTGLTPRSSIFLRFDSFDVEEDWDFVTVYDGSNLVGVFTGNYCKILLDL